MTNRKATGSNEIPAELFKVMKEDIIKTLTVILNIIYYSAIMREQCLAPPFLTIKEVRCRIM